MKRIVSICLVMCMVLSAAAGALMPKAAAAGDAAEMKTVLTQVKGKITIPEEYKTFNYRYNASNSQGSWVFEWEAENKYISITADSAGRIISYNNRVYSNTQEGGAPMLTRAEAQAKVQEFLQKAVPEVYPSLGKSPENYVSTERYSFTYPRCENGIPCENQSVTVRINYTNGIIEGMNMSWLHDVAFKNVASPITSEKAKGIWKENAELELKYLYKYNQEKGDGATEAYLVYTPVKEIKAINAETGEILEKEYEWVYSGDAGIEEPVMMDAAASGSTSNYKEEARLSEDELKKLAELENLITLAQADRKVRAITQLSLTSDFRISRSNLITSGTVMPLSAGGEAQRKFSWQIVYAGPTTKGKAPQTIYAYVNAHTGELESYGDYEAANRGISAPAKITEAQAREVAQSFVKKVSPTKAQSLLEPELSTDKLTNDKDVEVAVGWNAAYKRGNEGIPVANDGLRVTVNRMTGKVTRYNCTWEDNVSFESSAGVLEKDTATNAYIDNAEASLEYHIFTTYMYDEEGKSSSSEDKAVMYYGGDVQRKKSTILVYEFKAPSNVISAKTGEYTDVAEKEKAFRGYSDISGHFAEREITLLADVGILPQREKFLPQKNISQQDFLECLYKSGNSYWYGDVYDTALASGVITKAEVNPTGAVSRYQAIRFIVRYLGLGKLAADASAFRVSFADAASIPAEYVGSVAIGKSMQIVGGAGGRFNGANLLTNGEAVKMIYNAMKRRADY